MNIKTFKSIEYKGCPIYFRNIGYVFEYFTIINNELYTSHSTIRPILVRRILYRLGLKNAYTDKEYQKILNSQFVGTMAMSVVDSKLEEMRKNNLKNN